MSNRELATQLIIDCGWQWPDGSVDEEDVERIAAALDAKDTQLVCNCCDELVPRTTAWVECQECIGENAKDAFDWPGEVERILSSRSPVRTALISLLQRAKEGK